MLPAAKRPTADLFYQDFKKFSAGDIQFGVGQITALDPIALKETRLRLATMLDNAKKEHGLDMIFFMLTNILEESTMVLCSDPKALEVAEVLAETNIKGIWNFAHTDLNVPVIIIHGEKDMAVPVEYGKKYSELYPNCEFYIVPESEHCYQRMSRREFVNSHIIEFLEK